MNSDGIEILIDSELQDIIDNLTEKIINTLRNDIPRNVRYGHYNISINVLLCTLFNVLAPHLRTENDEKYFYNVIVRYLHENFILYCKNQEDKDG